MFHAGDLCAAASIQLLWFKALLQLCCGCRYCNLSFCELGNEPQQIFLHIFKTNSPVALQRFGVVFPMKPCSITICCLKKEIIINRFKIHPFFVGLQQWQGFISNVGIKILCCQRFCRTRDEDSIQIKESGALKYLPFPVITSQCGFAAQLSGRKGHKKNVW